MSPSAAQCGKKRKVPERLSEGQGGGPEEREETMNQKRKSAASRVAFLGLLFAMALVLSVVESMLPVLPMLPPGVKLGLSNIITMYALFLLGPAEGFTIAVLKSFWVFLLRGAVGAGMSVCGGLVSLTLMLLVSALPGMKGVYLILSIFGAIGHNLGQLCMARVLLGTSKIWYYIPIMVLSGIVMGVVTGVVLRAVMPYINRLNLQK